MEAHKEVVLYQCHSCDELFDQISALKSHSKTHEKVRIFGPYHENSLNTHMKIHSSRFPTTQIEQVTEIEITDEEPSKIEKVEEVDDDIVEIKNQVICIPPDKEMEFLLDLPPACNVLLQPSTVKNPGKVPDSLYIQKFMQTNFYNKDGIIQIERKKMC